MSKPHLLYIAFFYPPSRASGVYRALATSQAFVDAGWDVTVITTSAQFFEEEIGSTDDSLLDLIPDSVSVERVSFSFLGHGPPRNLRDMGRFSGNFPLVARFGRTRTQSLREAIDVIRGRSPLAYAMSDRYVTWIEPVVARARDVAAQQPIDHVLATGNPYSAFEASRIISDLTGAPFSIDYRDPWAFDLRTGGPAKLTAATSAAEERIVNQAAACIHVNQPIADAYADRYPAAAGKQHVVLNGYDEASISPPRRPYRGGPLRYGMLGTVTDLWPLEPLFQAWIDRRGELPEGSELLLGGHLGYFAWSEEGLAGVLPDKSVGFRYQGPVPKAHVADFYGQLDVVVVPLFGGPMVTSGKVFEAAGLGLPVVCIQPEGGGARQVLEDHPLAFGVAPEADAVAGALLAAADLTQRLSPEEIIEVRRSMARYERQTSMRTMVRLIEQHTAERQAP